jgi:hypothetical protein
MAELGVQTAMKTAQLTAAQTPNEWCYAAFRWKHAGEKTQIAGLHRFQNCTEGLTPGGRPETTFLQPLLCAGRPGDFEWAACF